MFTAIPTTRSLIAPGGVKTDEVESGVSSLRRLKFDARCLRHPRGDVEPASPIMSAPAVLGDQHQRFNRRAPCLRVGLALRQLGDVVGGVAQGEELAAAGQGD